MKFLFIVGYLLQNLMFYLLVNLCLTRTDACSCYMISMWASRILWAILWALMFSECWNSLNCFVLQTSHGIVGSLLHDPIYLILWMPSKKNWFVWMLLFCQNMIANCIFYTYIFNSIVKTLFSLIEILKKWPTFK